jgi:hypothetical protein
MTIPTTTKLPYIWAVRPDEMEKFYSCDGHLADPDAILWRAVDIAAPASTAFRWLCQIRVAPYSYDWIDNRGRRSPPELTPGAEILEPGQSMMSIFRLVDLKTPEHLTIVMSSLWGLMTFGAVAVTYQVLTQQDRRARMVVKLRVRYPRTLWGRCMRILFPWGDLWMMRKQLLTLKRLAERSGREV